MKRLSYANKIKLLSESRFVQNVAIVASGTAGAQAIGMAFTPVITRLYGPEAFGVLGTFTAILGALAPLAALSYPMAIVLPKRDVDAVSLAKLSIWIAIVTSMFAALILLLFKGAIVSILSLQAVEPFIFLLPLAMLLSVTMAIMSQWVIRKKLYKIKARMAVLQALWLESAKAGVGLVSPVAAVLVILATLSNMIHALMLWVSVRKSVEGQINLDQQPKDIVSSKTLAWRYRDFAYYRTPQIVLSAASQSMPVLMLTSFFGPAAAGFYTLSRLTLSVPTLLIGQSVTDVFYPKFVEILHKGKSGRAIIVKSSLALIGVGMFPYLLIIAFGPMLFGFVFGQNWIVAGELARWMSIWLLSILVTRPVIAAIPALGLQRAFLIFEIVAFALRGGAIALGYALFSSAIGTIATLSLVNVLIYSALYSFVVSRS